VDAATSALENARATRDAGERRVQERVLELDQALRRVAAA
jgi:hypothetical protein